MLDGGAGGFGSPVPSIPKPASCQTKPGHLDPPHPHHLRGLLKVRLDKKQSNFPLPTGFNQV